jgi:DnaJ-class molecular chaperone
MNINIDKFKEYLTLFGLDDDYTLDDLTSSFRILAKLNHPDLIKDQDSDQRMALINKGHDLLKDVLTSGQIQYLKIEKQKEKKDDIFYYQYKKAFLILKNAFEEYFGDGETKNNFRDEKILKEKLTLAKTEFSKLVNGLPYNEWINDAIDKISSINKWLD